MIRKSAKPFLLGLTGSIGMGKSTAAEMFRAEGVPVWDADEAVHKLYSKGGAAVDPVAELCPQAIKDGAIDRAVLATWISGDSDRLKQLETVVHPLVAVDRKAFKDAAQEEVLLFDIPLLFETGADRWLDAVAVVSTDAQTQKNRVLSRPGMTTEKFELILSKQTPDAEKRQMADYLIPSDTLEGATKAVKDIIRDIEGRLDA